MYDNYMIPIFSGTIGEVTKAKLAKYENSRTFAIVFDRLVNMALDYRYSFDGLPDTMNDRVIKQSLLFYGSVVFFKLNGSTPIALAGVGDGKAIDIYGNPRSAWVYSRNGKLNQNLKLNYSYDDLSIQNFDLGVSTINLENVEMTDGVIIWERKTRTPFIWTVIYYAERIADTLRTLDLDRRWLKRPFIPRCEESEAKSFDESLKKFMANEDFSVSLKARNIDKTDIFTVDISPQLVTNVTQLVEWYESQYKILLGIQSNSQVDKKGENLITDELHIDDSYIEMNLNSVKEEMQSQIDVFNNLSGLSITVEDNQTKKDAEEEQEQFQNAMSQEGNNENKDLSGNN